MSLNDLKAFEKAPVNLRGNGVSGTVLSMALTQPSMSVEPSDLRTKVPVNETVSTSLVDGGVTFSSPHSAVTVLPLKTIEPAPTTSSLLVGSCPVKENA